MRTGSYFTVAANAVGVDTQTYNEWIRQGQRDRSGPCHDLWREVRRASAEAEVAHVANVTSSESGWRASAWWLERRHSKRWGKTLAADVTSGGKALRAPVVALLPPLDEDDDVEP